MSSQGPKNDPKNPLHYIPTNSYTAVAVGKLLSHCLSSRLLTGSLLL